MPREQCKDVLDRKCHTTYVDDCCTEQRSVCNDVPEVVERQVQHETCEDVPVENCDDVPSTVCKDVSRNTCSYVV